jgi:hypothetical protein
LTSVWALARHSEFGGCEHRVQEVFKARFLELMHGRGTGETINATNGRENVCEICKEKGNWYHITSMCIHPDIKLLYNET